MTVTVMRWCCWTAPTRLGDRGGHAIEAFDWAERPDRRRPGVGGPDLRRHVGRVGPGRPADGSGGIRRPRSFHRPPRADRPASGARCRWRRRRNGADPLARWPGRVHGPAVRRPGTPASGSRAAPCSRRWWTSPGWRGGRASPWRWHQGARPKRPVGPTGSNRTCWWSRTGLGPTPSISDLLRAMAAAGEARLGLLARRLRRPVPGRGAGRGLRPRPSRHERRAPVGRASRSTPTRSTELAGRRGGVRRRPTSTGGTSASATTPPASWWGSASCTSPTPGRGSASRATPAWTRPTGVTAWARG